MDELEEKLRQINNIGSTDLNTVERRIAELEAIIESQAEALRQLGVFEK